MRQLQTQEVQAVAGAGILTILAKAIQVLHVREAVAQQQAEVVQDALDHLVLPDASN
jgi:hypothetical protein